MFNHSKRMVIIAVSVFLLAFPYTSMASASTGIHGVTIDIHSNIGSEDRDVEVDVTTDSDQYYVDEVSVVDESDVHWTDEDQPLLRVHLKADDDYTFSHNVTVKECFNGCDGKGVGGRLTESYLISYVGLDVLKDDDNDDVNVNNLDVGDLDWDETYGTARWKGDADKYQIKLYHGGRWITSLTTQSDSYDFSGYIIKEGYYNYKVCAISDSSHKGKWKKSNNWHVTSDEAKEISSNKLADRQKGPKGPGISNRTGAWIKDNTGWRYRNDDKSNTVRKWLYINDKWYYFNESGYMVTGWTNWKTKWYYCGEDGAMETNTTTPDGYHVGSDGAWTGV